jgi:hypothetical protein
MPESICVVYELPGASFLSISLSLFVGGTALAPGSYLCGNCGLLPYSSQIQNVVVPHATLKKAISTGYGPLTACEDSLDSVLELPPSGPSKADQAGRTEQEQG